jgi:DNA-binding SARP family transcriptional activator
MSIPAESLHTLPHRGLRSALCLMGGPYVFADGHRYAVPEGSKRLLVFLALHGQRLERRYVAGTLWPEGDDSRASGNLRSALWRLKCAGIDIVEADKCVVWLKPDTVVDIQSLYEWARRLIDGSAADSDLQIMRWDPEAANLLPGWYDDWVIFERERTRQRLLHGLESLSIRLTRLGRYAEAVEAALDAIDLEPLRESAHRALIEAHLAEGNIGEARRAFTAYAHLARSELGVSVSPALRALIEPLQVRTS